MAPSGLFMKCFVILAVLLFSVPLQAQKGVFLAPNVFSAQAFPEPTKVLQTLWLNRALRDRAGKILGHSYAGLRQRYWGQGSKTAWVFEEIGKELPITVGVVIENNRIAKISILEYRESRGGEVRYPFFTDQFKQLGLIKTPKKYALDGSIDGITGATLSVRAIKKVATLALMFHHNTPFTQVGSSRSQFER